MRAGIGLSPSLGTGFGQVDEVEVFGTFGGDLPAFHRGRESEDKTSGQPGGQYSDTVIHLEGPSGRMPADCGLCEPKGRASVLAGKTTASGFAFAMRGCAAARPYLELPTRSVIGAAIAMRPGFGLRPKEKPKRRSLDICAEL
jgi:hypothetical protein